MLPRGAPAGGPFGSVFDFTTSNFDARRAASSPASVNAGQVKPLPQLSDFAFTSAFANATQQEWTRFAMSRSAGCTVPSTRSDVVSQLSKTYTISAEWGAPCACSFLRHSGT